MNYEMFYQSLFVNFVKYHVTYMLLERCYRNKLTLLGKQQQLFLASCLRKPFHRFCTLPRFITPISGSYTVSDGDRNSTTLI